MAIDLNSCNGCNACVVALRRGKKGGRKGSGPAGRDMHWIRIDRLLQRETSQTIRAQRARCARDPEVFFQPVTCMQCENAPCEQVCPVAATVHQREGLNDMVLQPLHRTALLLPTTVRTECAAFNFLRFQDWETPQFKLMRKIRKSPVRSRGVMKSELLRAAHQQRAHRSGKAKIRPICDGEIVTACQPLVRPMPSCSQHQ